MPPFAGDTCEYVTDWIAVKVRWQLSIDPTEQRALDAKSADCPNTPCVSPSHDDLPEY